MGFFDRFKKKQQKEEPHYDVTNIKVTDLELSYVLDYDMDSWIVDKMYEYDWGDHFFTREFLLKNGSKKIFLHVEEDDDLELSITEKISIRLLQENLKELIKEGTAPSSIYYKDTTYYLDSESPGYCRNIQSEDWYEIINWTYLDKSEEQLICIEQSGKDDIEATIGKYIPEFKISNILPQNSSYDL